MILFSPASVLIPIRAILSESFACSSDAGKNQSKQNPPPLPSGVQGLGMGLPDLRSKKKGKQKVSKDAHVSEALDKLREQTVEAVKGIEFMSGSKPAGDDLGKDALVEDWLKQFEELAGSQVIISFSFTWIKELLIL